MILNELFDRGQPAKLVHSAGEYGSVNAEFQVGHHPYQMAFVTYPDFNTEVEFFHKRHGWDVTGDGNEFQVFSIVLATIQEYIRQYDPYMLTFSAKLDEPSRVKLYNRMVRSIAHGFKVEVIKSGDDYDMQYRLTTTNPNNDFIQRYQKAESGDE